MDVGLTSHLVVNLLIIQNDAILLEQVDGGSWKLPGGHVEAGESPLDTVMREAKEELGLEVDFITGEILFADEPSARCLPTPFASFAHTVERDGSLNRKHTNVIYSYLVVPKGVPSAQEGQAIKWFSTDDLVESDEVNHIVKKIAAAGLLQVRTANMSAA